MKEFPLAMDDWLVARKQALHKVRNYAAIMPSFNRVFWLDFRICL